MANSSWKNAMRSAGYSITFALLVLGTGCSEDATTTATTNQEVPISVTYDIGGAVALEDSTTGLPDENIPVEAVTVTLTDSIDTATTATTTAEGLWEMLAIAPGIYGLSYAKTGFDSVNDQVQIEATGETNISNQFIGFGTQPLAEEGITATTSVSGSTLIIDANNPVVVDGFAGNTSVWDQASDISVTFNKTALQGEVAEVPGVVCLFSTAGTLLLYDSDADGSITATDANLCGTANAARTVFTFAEENLNLAGQEATGTVDGLIDDTDPTTQRPNTQSASTRHRSPTYTATQSNWMRPFPSTS